MLRYFGSLTFQQQNDRHKMSVIPDGKGTSFEKKYGFRGCMRRHWRRFEVLVCIAFTLDLNVRGAKLFVNIRRIFAVIFSIKLQEPQAKLTFPAPESCLVKS